MVRCFHPVALVVAPVCFTISSCATLRNSSVAGPDERKTLSAELPSSTDKQHRARTAQVEEAVKRFLRAFENLEWETFRHSFSDHASVFFPTPEPPRRFSGRSEFETQFKKVFAAIRAANEGKRAPYHRLDPIDLRVDFPSDNVAVVTFLLVNEERTGRRTLILQDNGRGWRIVHLHASNVATLSETER